MSFLSSPASLVAQFFPTLPFNFDSGSATADAGPMETVFIVTGTRIAQYEADILLLKSQMTVQEAAGPYLDLHGVLYGIRRITSPYELDDHYRARILAGTKKLTIPAIQANVVAYYASVYPANQQPTVLVYDIQSDPVRSAAAGLVMFQFAVDVNFEILLEDVFFFDRSYLDRHDYLIDPEGTDTAIPESALAAVLLNVKAADTMPVFIRRHHLVQAYS